MSAPAIALIGAPTDVGAGTVGARMGPDALRVAGLPRALARLGRTVQDLGNLQGPSNPERTEDGSLRHLTEVAAWNRAVYRATRDELTAGRLPVLLGGDHSLAIGSIAAVADHCRALRRRLRVLWLDAHADLNTRWITPSGNLHGMPVACLFGLGPEPLSALGDTVPALHPSAIRMIGLCSVDPGERPLLHELGIETFDMHAIQENGMNAVMQQALAGVDADTWLHVSLDTDFLDPRIAPGVGTPERGGPSCREARLCMEKIAETRQLASLDLVELDPARDHCNTTAELLVDLVETLFGRQLPAHLRRQTGQKAPNTLPNTTNKTSDTIGKSTATMKMSL